MKSKGFTLIELLVVVAIISLLSSVVLASLREAREKAKITAFHQEVMQFVLATELYKTDNNGTLPDVTFGSATSRGFNNNFKSYIPKFLTRPFPAEATDIKYVGPTEDSASHRGVGCNGSRYYILIDGATAVPGSSYFRLFSLKAGWNYNGSYYFCYPLNRNR